MHGPRLPSCENEEYEREQREEGNYDLDDPPWEDDDAADDDPWWGCDLDSGVL